MKKILIAILMTFTLTACSGNGEELAAVKLENTQLKEKVATLEKTNADQAAELEDVKFGAPKLLEEIKQSFTDKKYDKVKDLAKTLADKHPASEEAKTANTILADVDKIEKDAKAAIAAEEKKKADDLAAEEKKKADAIKKAQEEEKQRLATAVSKMRKVDDEVSGFTWYYDKTTTEYIDENAFYTYISQKDNILGLRLKIQYQGDDWVFIKSYVIKTDNNTYEIDAGYGAVERDNGYSGVWEWYDVQTTDNDIAMIQDIISSSKTIVRSQGDQKIFDRNITSAEKKALQNVLDAYQALGGKIGTAA